MAKRLTKLKVDEVSVVDKAANNKRFLILKQAGNDHGPEDPGSIKKAGRPSLFGRVRRAKAGRSGPTDGGTDMTPEDVRKAVTEAAEEILAPIEERIGMLESAVAKSLAEEAPADTETGEAPAKDETPEPLTPEAVAKIVGGAVTDAVAPLATRIEVLESAAGARRSGLEEQGAHTVTKADGSFSWEGSGLLI